LKNTLASGVFRDESETVRSGYGRGAGGVQTNDQIGLNSVADLQASFDPHRFAGFNQERFTVPFGEDTVVLVCGGGDKSNAAVRVGQRDR
jgi:hypothetical protein